MKNRKWRRALAALGLTAVSIGGCEITRVAPVSAMEVCVIVSQTTVSTTVTCNRDILVPSGYKEYFQAGETCVGPWGQISNVFGSKQYVPGNRSTATCKTGYVPIWRGVYVGRERR